MKRFFQFIGIVLLVGVIFAVGAYGEPYTDPMPTPRPSPAPPPDAQVEQIDFDLMSPAIIEYGAPFVLKHNNDPLHAYIRFPQAGNLSDIVIAEWAHTLFEDISGEMDIVLNNNPSELGEINLHFDSFLIDDRYAGIFQKGWFTLSLAGTPEEIIQTFNIDLLTDEFLEPFDILNHYELESLINLLTLRLLVEHPRTDGNIHHVNENWFSHLFISHEGVVVVIPQYADFLPDEFETLAVTLPFEDLGTNLLIRREAPPPAATPDFDFDFDLEPDDELPPGNDDDYDNDLYDSDPGDEEPLDDDFIDDEPLVDDPPVDESDTDNDYEFYDPYEPTEPTAPTVPPQSGFIDPALPMIALSFDNGPGNYFEDFLDLLERYNVRATFSVLGNLVDTQPDALRRAVASGNEVIGNSWNHRNLAKLTENYVSQQIINTNNSIEAITGVSVPLFRPPYGEVSDTMRRISEDLGFAMVNWNIDPEDWRATDAAEIATYVLEQAHDGAIIMSHEVFASTFEAYQYIIPELLSRGFQIVTISELLLHTFDEIEPGRVYFSAHDVS